MKKLLLIIGGAFLLIVVLGLIGISKSDSPTQAEKQEVVVQVTPKPPFEYDILSRVEGKTDENISVLIKSGEPNPKGLAEEVQKTCKKQCNVSLYDDRKAFELNDQYDKMMGTTGTTPDDLQAWKKKNYIFVAEHLVGQMGYSFGPYDDYPFKDWYYKELKGIK